MPAATTLLQQGRELLPLAGGLALVMSLPQFLSCWRPGSADCSLLGLHAWASLAWHTGLFAVLLTLVEASRRWLPAQPRRRQQGLLIQIAVFALLPSLAPVGMGLFGSEYGSFSLYALQVQLTGSAATCLVLEYRSRARAQRADAERLLRDERGLARQLDAARSALLQAQVEPHFLFNTLAHLRRLASLNPDEARAMLADLLRYLEAALPSLRKETTSLGQELTLVRAFLALHQRRIGPERLQLRFEIEPGLDAAVLPSTCLLTLAENAIKHGIAPQVAGGEIAVTARQAGGRLVLEVADTGAGMGSGSGSGTGLATLRARLAAHRGGARLSLLLNQPTGLIARIEVPA